MFRDSILLKGKADGTVFTREQSTDKFVSIPPAYMITDEVGATWIFGPEYVEERGRFWFAVMRNDVNTGELAERIEFRPAPGRPLGQVSIYTRLGRKVWTGKTFI